MEEGRNCEVCGIDITDKKATARTCSPKCRKLLFQSKSVEQNGTETGTLSFAEPEHLDIWFEFRTLSKANGMGREKDEWSPIRKAKYWYDVPIAAIPVIKKGNPEMPDYMNGRQYFLWWKNEFKENELGPVLHNPFKEK